MTTAADRSRVLVVDDEPRMSEALRHLLVAEGYQVRTTECGSHALAIVSDWRPALVITDLMMAPMNGIELCRQVRLESGTPIIVVSADNSERSKVAALQPGRCSRSAAPGGVGSRLVHPSRVLARVHATAPEEADSLRSCRTTQSQLESDCP